MGLDSHGSTPFGQRRSQATLWPDSLRLLQVPRASILRKQNKKAFGSLESFCWCGRWDLILTARRRSVSAALRPHCGLIHYGFFKSHALRFFVSKTKKPSVLSKAFAWCGRWDLILTARRRSVSAALRPHCGLIHYGFFKSHALRFFVSKTKKPSVLSKAFAGAVDGTGFSRLDAVRSAPLSGHTVA